MDHGSGARMGTRMTTHQPRRGLIGRLRISGPPRVYPAPPPPLRMPTYEEIAHRVRPNRATSSPRPAPPPPRPRGYSANYLGPMAWVILSLVIIFLFTR
jgi:hypothetical protein